ALDQLEGEARRREEELASPDTEPQRTAHAACEQELRAAVVEPPRRHRAVQLLERRGGAPARAFGEGEDDLGVDRHTWLGPCDAVLVEQLVVVRDRPVVDADDGGVPDWG